MVTLDDVIAQVQTLKVVQVDVARLLETLEADGTWQTRANRTDALGEEMRAFEQAMHHRVVDLVRAIQMVQEFERLMEGTSAGPWAPPAEAVGLMERHCVALMAICGIMRDQLSIYINTLRGLRGEAALQGIESAMN